MKNVKKIAWSVVSSVMAMPFFASAQFQQPQGTGLPAGSLLGIITSGMNWLLIVVGILGVIGFVIAGIIYLTAAGDDDQISKGKKAMVYSIVGVIVALLGIVIIQAVQALLGGSSKTF
jgi:uncharacterized membrane protein